MAAPRKPKGDQLRGSLQKPSQSPQEPSESIQQQGPPTGKEKDLQGFTVRLEAHQKEKLERLLWERHGEKLAAGVRRIITEWMNRQ